MKQAREDEKSQPNRLPRSVRGRLRRWIPLVLLLALGSGFWLLIRLQGGTPGQILQLHHERLLAYVQDQPVPAATAYLLTYSLAVALSLPVASLMTMAGGYLFGILPGTLLAVFGATAGATGLFLAARGLSITGMRARAGGRLERLQQGFERGAFNYLLALRLVPLFPFWLVNLAAAIMGVPLGRYLAATLLGMLPSSLIFAATGAGLGSLLDASEEQTASRLLEPALLLPLLGLALLALLPLLYRAWRARRRGVRGT
ncbi:MAG TPA: TVP38/TMEM64 family protein [Kiloniellales bacterium]|nr:TVP38/TMEM64 family protein [Kiloniellales bacterium]